TIVPEAERVGGQVCVLREICGWIKSHVKIAVCAQNMSGNLLLAPSSAQDLPCKRRRGRRLEHKKPCENCQLPLGIVNF
ncbi:MAG: hypothetical protein Q7T89_11910, partial [Anaerolineales bacterium]|nr:hypothetical protein [Anaerolineales bacterium]